MGTKQIRLSQPEDFHHSLNQFLGKKINLVLKNKHVITGDLKISGKDFVEIQNYRFKTFRFSLPDIEEIFIDR